MLRRLLAALAVVATVAAAGFALHLATAQGDTMFAGKRPTYLGVKDGRLPRPRSTPNCVSSQADRADQVHYVEPIRFQGTAPEAMAVARRAVEAMPRATVIRHEGNYLYAEFRSRLLGFVDDGLADVLDPVNPLRLLGLLNIDLSEKLRTAGFIAIALGFGLSLTTTSVQTPPVSGSQRPMARSSSAA